MLKRQGLNRDVEEQTRIRIAKKLQEQMDAHQRKHADVADYLGVTPSAIYGYLKTGRVAKDKLPKLAAYFRTSLAYWHGSDEEEEGLTPEERRLLALFRDLGPNFQKRLLDDANHLRDLQAPILPSPGKADAPQPIQISATVNHPKR